MGPGGVNPEPPIPLGDHGTDQAGLVKGFTGGIGARSGVDADWTHKDDHGQRGWSPPGPDLSSVDHRRSAEDVYCWAIVSAPAARRAGGSLRPGSASGDHGGASGPSTARLEDVQKVITGLDTPQAMRQPERGCRLRSSSASGPRPRA